jgi:ribosome-associated protein
LGRTIKSSPLSTKKASEDFLTSKEIINKIIKLAQEKKGAKIVKMNIGKLTTLADYFVMISGDSEVQVKAIADHIEDKLHHESIYLYQKEGYQGKKWILLDYSHIIVHIMKNDIREHYSLERLWADAEIEYINENIG